VLSTTLAYHRSVLPLVLQLLPSKSEFR
jgi:hypothetical protein